MKRVSYYRQILENAVNRSANYLERLDNRSVGPVPGSMESLQAMLKRPIPDKSQNPEEILALLDEFGSPATVASAGGRYFGFVTGGSLPVTIAAQYLATAWDQNSFSYVSSPAIAAIEEAALREIKNLFLLPRNSAGAIVTGATMANFTCLASARNHVLSKVGWGVREDGLFGAPPITVVVGEEAHATVYKVLSMLGMGRSRVLTVPADEQGRMRADLLPEISGPAIVCIQAGNVNSGAFDPALEIIDWAHTPDSSGNRAWVHVDGAFGIWTLASPDMAHMAEDFMKADSWATDCHKWLNVPYDSGLALVRNAQAMKDAMSTTGAYLLPSDSRDALDFTPDSSRRARAVEVWAALNALGLSGLADLIDRNCRQARDAADMLRAGGVEILNEVVLNQVVVSFGDNKTTQRIIDEVQAAGICWCGATNWRGRAAMRISVSSWATTDEDIDRSVQSILTVFENR